MIGKKENSVIKFIKQEHQGFANSKAEISLAFLRIVILIKMNTAIIS